MRFFYHFGRYLQAISLAFILYVLISSAYFGKGMGFLFLWTIIGMVMFLIGWLFQTGGAR